MGSASAFGLEVSADRPLSFLDSGAEGASERRGLRLSLAPEDEPDWRPGEMICDERRRDGEVEFQIEASPGGEFELRGPAYGAFRIDASGRELWGRTGDGGIVAWQRFLVAQSLPFVAAMRGLEVFHASAVVLGGEAVAFTGPSGTGKTSLALALRRQGASLLADDVLAVEWAGGELLAHPGAPVAAIERAEARRLREERLWDGVEVLGENEREVLVRNPLHPAPAPLRALFVLERRGGVAARFEPAAARELIGSTFNLVLGSPRRLAAQLEVCAELASRQVARLVFGPVAGPDELAELVLERLGGSR